MRDRLGPAEATRSPGPGPGPGVLHAQVQEQVPPSMEKTANAFIGRRRWKKAQCVWHLGLTDTLSFVSGSVLYLHMD